MNSTGVSYGVTDPVPRRNGQPPTRTTSSDTNLPPSRLPQRSSILRSAPQGQTRSRAAAQPFSLAAGGSGFAAAMTDTIKQTEMSYSAVLLVFVFTVIIYYLLSTKKADEMLQKLHIEDPTGTMGTLIKAGILGLVVIISIKIGGA